MRTFSVTPARLVWHALSLALLAAAAAFVLVPLVLALLNSLKTDGEILNDILALPVDPRFDNYATAFRKTEFPRNLWNTIVVAAIGVGGIVVCASLAGYKLSRTPGMLSRVLFGLFVFSMLVPFHSIMIPLTRIAKELEIQGGTVGLGVIYIGIGVPMAVFLYHGFVKSVPREVEESAIIDGCGELALFARVVFPLLAPITATVAILNLLWIWNDFLLPLLMLTNSKAYTLLLSTNMLFGEYGNHDWASILAALIMTMAPAIVFYLLLQRHIMRGIAEGAVKG
jgi:raffinose/stachyose/melibiose transport system permease protein